MFTENGLNVDLESVRDTLERADVITIGFPFIAERLLLDLRTTDQEGPLMTIVDPVGNIQERYMWLGQHRGAFGLPEAFSFFAWPHSVRVLQELDVLAPVRHRIAAMHHSDPDMLDDALLEMEALEQDSIVEAIVGGGHWRTVWERQDD